MAGVGKKRLRIPCEMKPKKRRSPDGMITITRYGDDYIDDDDDVHLYERFTGTNTWRRNGHAPVDEFFIDGDDSYESDDEHNGIGPAYFVESAAHPDTDTLNAENGFLRFTVKINNINAFTSESQKVTSDTFSCRGLPFQLIVQNRTNGLTLGAYVCRVESGHELHDAGLEIGIDCELSVYDQIDETYKLKKNFTNCFRAGSDWGFTRFLENKDITAAGPGILYNNSLIIDVQLKANPPHCNNNFSKAITGYVGIRNQGATCYMNSLLQVLFFLTKFRTACYRIPTEMDESTSMALALQKVFYNLEFSDSPVCTKNLTKSFGWSTVDVLMQHDVQEMMRVLIDRIESRMKNTLLEPILPSIFQGKFVSYVKCRDIEFSSQREEVFYDIQLSLENSCNLYDSFRRYVSPEMMDDDNKYHAGTHGLQAAEKGTLFISLPPVMFLHLLRFQFDPILSQVAKNNNFFEFYDHIDLAEYVREDESANCKYTLFAVLSHSGGGSHGHYVAYINPSVKGQWFKFDDEKISMVSKADAIDSNFGSNFDVDEWTKSLQLNAYMLVYVRDNMADNLFEPTDAIYISEELKRISLRKPDEEICYNLKNTYYKTDVFVLLNTLLESDVTFRLKQVVDVPRFSVSRHLTTKEFKHEVVSAFHLSDINQIRIWRMVYTSTNSTHSASPAYLNDEDSFLQSLDCMRSYSSTPPTVWIEMALPGEILPPFNPEKDVLVFYNFYCAEECRQLYIHHGYHDKDCSMAELVPMLNQLMGWTDRELNIYQIHRETKPVQLDVSQNFAEAAERFQSTFIMHIVFEQKEHDVSTKLNRITLYYQDLLCRSDLSVCNADDPSKEENFEMSLQSTFPEFMDKLAIRLNYDKMKIQIFNSYCNTPSSPVPSSSTGTLNSLFDCPHKRIQLFYKLHTVDVIDVETKQMFVCQWLSIDMKKQSKITLYLSDNETIESILAAAEKLIDSNQKNGSGKFRILSVGEDRLTVVEDVAEIYGYLEDVKDRRITPKIFYFRIEEIPKGDDILNEDELYVPVFQIRSNVQTRPGTHPFMFKANMSEPWQCVKEHLRSRLNISEKAWADYSPEVSTYSTSNDWDLEIDDTKCLMDIVQAPHGTVTICLNKAKTRRPSHKVDTLIKSLC